MLIRHTLGDTRRERDCFGQSGRLEAQVSSGSVIRLTSCSSYTPFSESNHREPHCLDARIYPPWRRIPHLDVFGKLGVARWTQTGGETFPPPRRNILLVDNHITKTAWGAGGQLHVGDLGACLEYENFDIRHINTGVHLVSLSVFFNFF